MPTRSIGTDSTSIRQLVLGSERVSEDPVGDFLALRDPLGLVEVPVNTQIDAALAVFFLGLR